ncbi:MAG: hypothetical protein LOD94_13185 [Gammaproteobacteria bacterium]|nr:hypothetical protein [Gammaproteobacteria bacterium]
MWLSKPLYEALPFVYMAAGLAAVIVGFVLELEAWSSMLVVVGLCALTGGLVLCLKRRDYRSSRSRAAFDESL